MKKYTVLLAGLTLFILMSGAFAAQPLTVDSKALLMLQNMASGECTPETCFDGQPILRREPPLVILNEEKISEYVDPGRYHQDYNHGHYRGHPGHHPGHPGNYPGHPGGWYEPPTLVTVYKQTVGVEDRGAFVKEEKKAGALRGGLFGLLGGLLVGLLAAPLGGAAVLAGLGLIAVGAVVGAKKGEADGKAAPTIFERIRKVVTPL